MATIGTQTTPVLDIKRRHGRAINAVASFLRNNLHVPNIYLEPRLLSHNYDILAVDRAGSGDFHLVEIRLSPPETDPLLKKEITILKNAPAHFKYLAVTFSSGLDRFAEQKSLFSPNGIGRVGLLRLADMEDGLPTVSRIVAPERFRLDAPTTDKIEKYITKTKPDIYVRI